MKLLSVESLTAILWTFTAIAILLTVGRLALHWRSLRKIRGDDIFNGIALALLLVFMITWQLYVPVEYLAQLQAAGLYEGPAPQYDPVFARKIDFANLVIFWCTLYSVKASFLALYWQIFEVSRRFRFAWTALVIYVGSSFAITILALFWHCGTPETLMNAQACRRWKPRAITIVYMTTVLHIVGDIFLMILPLVMLRALRTKLREKIGLAFMFGLVLVDVAFTILRVIFTVTEIFKDVPDRNILWATLDPIVAVMICALPCYRSVLSSAQIKPILRTAGITWNSSKLASSFKSSFSSTQIDGSAAADLEKGGRPYHIAS